MADVYISKLESSEEEEETLDVVRCTDCGLVPADWWDEGEEEVTDGLCGDCAEANSPEGKAYVTGYAHAGQPMETVMPTSAPRYWSITERFRVFRCAAHGWKHDDLLMVWQAALDIATEGEGYRGKVWELLHSYGEGLWDGYVANQTILEPDPTKTEEHVLVLSDEDKWEWPWPAHTAPNTITVTRCVERTRWNPARQTGGCAA